jgi:lysine 2,3-aminomutase
VLLKGVNDDASALEALFRKLVQHKVRPYYLHHPDLAPGTSHFRVPIETGQALMRSLRGRLSGLCLPTYVLDIPGGFGKVPIGPAYVGARCAEGSREILDNGGNRHRYPE